MGVEPKIGVGKPTPPNHPFVHRVLNHEIFTIHFGGYCTPIFGNSHMKLFASNTLARLSPPPRTMKVAGGIVAGAFSGCHLDL